MPFFASNIQVQNLWLLFCRTYYAMQKARSRELRKYGISTSEAEAILAIKTIDKQATPTQISQWMLREPHTVYGLLKRMEKKGLIVSNKDQDRKNLISVYLAENGEILYRQLYEKKIERIITTLSSQRQHQLITLLTILLAKALKVQKKT
ncbi:MarR family winged helix-turn-helix transcriptional regulator [Chloroflexota bacterium]